MSQIRQHMANLLWGATVELLIPEYSGTAAASVFVTRSFDPDATTLVY